MNKREFINAVSDTCAKAGKDFTLADIERVVDSTIDTIIDKVAAGEDVQFVGFGTFTQSERAARNGVNPRTKETIAIPATKTPRFKAGKVFKDAVKA